MNIADLIRDLAPQQTTNLIIATVDTPPPNLTLKYADQTIYPQQIYCSNYLLQEYHRTYKFKGIIDDQHQDVSSFKQDISSSSMTLNGMGPHEHKITKVSGSGSIESTGNYNHHGDLWLTDTLKKGDEVLVAIVGVFYVVVTKITKMPNKAIEGV